MHNFVWKWQNKIKRLALIGDYKNGGLKIPHIESVTNAQCIMCLKKYLDVGLL